MKIGTIIQDKRDGEYYIVKGYHFGNLLVNKIGRAVNQDNVGDDENQEYQIVFEFG